MNILLVGRPKRHDIAALDAERVDANFDQAFIDIRAIVTALRKYRIDLNVDVNGNLDVSHLDGGRNADAAHVWTGNGTWQPGGGGGLSAAQIAARVIHGL
jgi:hypothetical protein